MMEEWRDVVGYEGLYQVSNLGRVRSVERVRITDWGARIQYGGNIMIPAKHNTGYVMVRLHKDGRRKPILLHRIVATAFLPNPDNLREVNHIDEDKTNNAVSNLEWCSPTYNNNYGTHLQRRTQNVHGTRAIECRKVSGEYVGTYALSREAAAHTGVSRIMIFDVLRGIRESTKGYIFKYIDTEPIKPLYEW